MNKQRVKEIQHALKLPRKELSKAQLTHYGEVGIRKGYQFWEVCSAVHALVSKSDETKEGTDTLSSPNPSLQDASFSPIEETNG